MRNLTPKTLVGLMALCIPPVEGTDAKNPVREFKDNHFNIRCTRCRMENTSFDLERLSTLINQFIGVPLA